MALPFILWGAAALLAGTGVVKGVGAMNDFDEAKRIGRDAEDKYQNTEASLQYARDQTNSAFEKLGRTKMHIFNHQIKHLVEAIRKSKNASSKLAGFEQSISTEELKEMECLVMASLEIEKGLGAGAATGALAAWGAYGGVMALGTASTGAAIGGLSGVAATNATLAWLGGGALSAGGFGMAGGALALGGIVLGPALAVGGFMMASRAEEALTKAREYEAEVDIAVAEMKKMNIVLEALQSNAKEMQSTLTQLAQRFDAIKVNDDSNIPAFEQMIIVGKGIKSVLDTAIMEKDGSATKNLKSKISGYLEV
jgi:hypothetical protein